MELPSKKEVKITVIMIKVYPFIYSDSQIDKMLAYRFHVYKFESQVHHNSISHAKIT
jgi:hypothetical protein